MLPDPLILLPRSLFNGEAGEVSCETAWGIPSGPQLFVCHSCLPRFYPAQIWHRNTPFFPVQPLPSSPAFPPAPERDPQLPRSEEQAGKGNPAPRHIYWAAARCEVIHLARPARHQFSKPCSASERGGCGGGEGQSRAALPRAPAFR